MKIFILSPNKKAVFTPELINQLEKSGELIFETKPKSFEEISQLFESGQKIIAADPDFFDWKFPVDILDKVPDLKAVCLETTSFSWIDIAYAKEKNIAVTNLRGFSTEAVAEYAFMMTLGAARKLSLVIKDNFKQDFLKDQGIELKGRTMGVIGLGRIGARFGEICEGFGMNVIYWSKNSRNEKWKFVELKELMTAADVIFPALARNNETADLLSDSLLRSMKRSAIFVGVAHGSYNHEVLLEMAKQGQIYGYAFEEENGNPLGLEGNVFALPSIAWATDGSMKANGEMWTASIIAAAKGDYPTRVN